METYTLPVLAYPAELCSISMALFCDIESAAGLRKRLIAASSMEGSAGDVERRAVDFAFLDARMVSCAHVLELLLPTHL